MNKRKIFFLDKNKYNKCLIKILKFYYGIKDIDEDKNYSKIFKMLYDSKDIVSYENIEHECFISNHTLKDYIFKFNKLAKKIFNFKNDDKNS